MNYFWEIFLALVLLLFAYKNIAVVRYNMKFYFFYAWLVTLMSLLIPAFLLKPRNPENLMYEKSRL